MASIRHSPLRVALALAAGFAAAAGSLAPAFLAPARADEPAGTSKVDFVREVKPVLEAACVKCHGPKQAKGRYRLDGREAALRGGESAKKTGRAAIVPGKPEESLLVLFIEATAKDPDAGVTPMPPGKEARKLSAEEKALLRRWVAEGAAWPDKVALTPPPAK